MVRVVDGSPAARAGVRPEDILLEVDATPVRGMDDLQRLMDRNAIGRRCALLVARGGELMTLTVTPVELAL